MVVIDFDKIGKYQVTGKLGQGSFGVVYQGRDDYLKRDVAIKVCSVEDENLRKRFQREGQISAKLSHRSIVTVYEAGSENGVPFLVQEMLSGEDMSRLVKRREALAPALKLDYLLQVAGGLDYAHSEGVIHRDIKPGNIRVLGDGRIKIMDFGIAKLASAETQLTRKGVTMGTASYLPPEQIKGVELDHRADIFSFGVLAYELLTFVRPFKGNTLSALIYQILYKIPQTMREVWPDCPVPLSDLIAKCLEKKPERRYASFTELIPRLADIRADVLAGRWPALREVTRVPGAERSNNEPSDVLSQTAIAQTARSVLEGKVGDYTISTAASPPEVLRPKAKEGSSTRPIEATSPAAAPPVPSPPAEALSGATQVVEPQAPSADQPTADQQTIKLTAEETRALDSLVGKQSSDAGLKTQIVSIPPAVEGPGAEPSVHATQQFAPELPAPELPAPELPATDTGDADELTLKAQLFDLVAEGKLAAEAAKERLDATIRPKDPVDVAVEHAEPEAAKERRDASFRPKDPVDVAVEQAVPATPPALPSQAPEPEPVDQTTAEVPQHDHPLETSPESSRSDTYRTIYRPPIGVLRWAGAAAAVIAVVGLGWLLFGGDGDVEVTSVEEVAPEPVVQPRETAPALGAVTVTAVPWAQVTEIRSVDSVQTPQAPSYTPLYLELAPGRYTLELQHPESDESQSCEVEVKVGIAASCEAAFPEPDVNEYFKETGWWD